VFGALIKAVIFMCDICLNWYFTMRTVRYAGFCVVFRRQISLPLDRNDVYMISQMFLKVLALLKRSQRIVSSGSMLHCY